MYIYHIPQEWEGKVAGFCEYDNEVFGSVKVECVSGCSITVKFSRDICPHSVNEREKLDIQISEQKNIIRPVWEKDVPYI